MLSIDFIQTRLDLLQQLFRNSEGEVARRILDAFSRIEKPQGSLIQVIKMAQGVVGYPPLWKDALIRLAQGRDIHTLIPHAERIASEAGFEREVRWLRENVPTFRTPVVSEDGRVQYSFERLVAGAATLNEFNPALFSPAGALAHGMIYFLERRGLQAHWEISRASDTASLPPALFGLLGRREDPERLRSFNQDVNDGDLGDVSLNFPEELRMAVLPSTVAAELRRHIPIQYIMPTAEALPTYFDKAWAKNLPARAIIVTGIKGLVISGKTPLEQFLRILKEADREDVALVDVLGFGPSAKMMREQRELLAGDRDSVDSWDLVLASTSWEAALEIARRWAGPKAIIREVVREFSGCTLSLTEVESTEFKTKLRTVILTDNRVILANEIASIYKNLEAFDLGRQLCDRMVSYARDGRRADHNLKKDLRNFYNELMEQAKKDIEKVIQLEGLPPVILPEVLNDLYGSWDTESFLEMYKLVAVIFDSHANRQERIKAMILLKVLIRRYYSVRNPCYGFCHEADQEAIKSGLWASQNEFEEAVAELRQEERWPDDVNPHYESSTHKFFSMIPEGLSPEGLQVAEFLVDRYAEDKFKLLPETFRNSYNLIERLRREIFIDPTIQREIVMISQKMAQIVPGSDGYHREGFLGVIEELRERLMAARLSLFLLPRIETSHQSRRTRFFLFKVIQLLDKIIKNIRAGENWDKDNLSLLNQALLEILARVNLFYLLPPDEMHEELRSFWKRLGILGGVIDDPKTIWDLFPGSQTYRVLDPDSIAEILKLRGNLYSQVGQGLILLTREMSDRFHSETKGISKKNIRDVVQQLSEVLNGVRTSVAFQRDQDSFLFGIMNVLREITEKLAPTSRRLDPKPRQLIFQALTEAMIHARRFLIMPPDHAPTELYFTFLRIQKVLRSLEIREASPLWYFNTLAEQRKS